METLAQIYSRHSADRHSGMGDKGTLHSYISIYEELLAPYRLTAERVLEVGVAQGHSLRMWREYFRAGAEIIGVDLVETAVDGCQVIVGDSRHAGLYTGLGQLDVVIDDGNHSLDYQLETFAVIWPLVREGGLYIIEDVQNIAHTWQNFKSLGEIVTIYDMRAASKVPDDTLVAVWR